ncbi:MAG: DUF3293 domain-containing protein [Bradymonadia bacterium]
MLASTMDPVLHQAYLATTYRAETEFGPVRIRIGQFASKLDRILERNEVREWLFITAWNPASKRSPDDENKRRHRGLVSQIERLGLTSYPGWGVPDEPDWAPEKSLLVLGVDANIAGELCVRYGQNAVVMGHYGQRARLVYRHDFQ